MPHYVDVDRLDQPKDFYSSEPDPPESTLDQKDAEIRRLKSEMELRDLYMEELHTALAAQATELAALDDRLLRLEPADVAAQARRALPLPLIRVKKTQN